MQAPAPPPETITAANSPDWSTRAAAGRQLAAWADQNDIARILQQLLLDRGDTAVVEATCVALLRRNDIHGIRLVARAITAANDLLAIGLDHIDHLADAVRGHHLGPASPDTVCQFVEVCTTLRHDPDPATRAGADRLLEWARPFNQPDEPIN
jgi:hypothetical protein